MSSRATRFVRLLRTTSSERFLVLGDGAEELAAVDVHYLASGKVAGTMVVLGGALESEAEIAAVLEQLDDELLPEVSVEAGNVSFTVVRGNVVGNFLSHEKK